MFVRRHADTGNIAFSGGRIVAVTDDSGAVSFVASHYVTDHLGSVRAVVDISDSSPSSVSSAVLEQNRYYPFGERTGEIARNTVDIQVGYGTDHTPIVNSFGDVIVDTIIGVVSEVINVDVNISPFKGISNTKAVRAAREAADESLLPQVADGVRRQNAMLNAEKAAANQAISEGVGSVTGSLAGEVIKRL